MREIFKYVIYLSALLSWAYVTIMQMVYADMGIPYPPVFWATAVVAIVTFFCLVGMCIHDILTNDVPRYRSRRSRRRDARCLGVIRYVGNEWVAVKDHEDDQN